MGRAGNKAGRTGTKPVNQSPKATRKLDSSVVSNVKEEKEGVEGGGGGRGGSRGEEAASEPQFHLLAVLGVLIPHMRYTLPETRMETLRWLMWLHQQLPKRVSWGGGGRGPLESTCTVEPLIKDTSV